MDWEPSRVRRGKSASARDYYERALAIREKLAPNSLDVATSLNNLGVVAWNGEDLTAANNYHQRALAIFQKLAPDSLDVATSLNNLGVVARDRGDLATAGDYYQRALAIRQNLAPDSLGVASSLNNLGDVAWNRGDLAPASDYHQRALAIREKLAPPLAVARSLHNLGNVSRDRGDLAAARGYLQRALEIQERLAPDSLEVALSLHNLGDVARKQGDRTRAAELAARAWKVVLKQASSVSGDEARQAFGSHYADFGTRLIRYQTELGKYEEAFVTLEEGRAQALLQLLMERGLSSRLAPPQVWRSYQEADTAYNRLGKALEKAGRRRGRQRWHWRLRLSNAQERRSCRKAARAAGCERETEKARAEYTRARVQAERRWGGLRQSMEAGFPSPIDPQRARRLLPKGAPFVAFSVAESNSTLFLVRDDGRVEVFSLDIRLEELKARVKFVRNSVSGEAGGRGVKPHEEDIRVEAARTMFQKLFPPDAQAAISAAKRLILSPDGVLWDPPFAALIVNDAGEYLGLQKALVYAQSLTVFAQSLRSRPDRSAGKPNVLVVGNPLYDIARRAEVLAARRSEAWRNCHGRGIGGEARRRGAGVAVT